MTESAAEKTLRRRRESWFVIGELVTRDWSADGRCTGPVRFDRSSYSEMIRSAHSTRETKTAGLPNFAAQLLRSFSETPRAREQAPQENTGMCLATIFSRNSLRGGQPIGITASAVAFRIK